MGGIGTSVHLALTLKILCQWIWKLPFCITAFWSLENSSLYVIVMLMHISGWFFFPPIYSVFLGSLLPTLCYSVSLVTGTNNPTNLLIFFFLLIQLLEDQKWLFILDISAIDQYFISSSPSIAVQIVVL